MISGRRAAAALSVLLVTAAAATITVSTQHAPITPSHSQLKAGYGFDVFDDRQVAHFADDIFVGRVAKVLTADEDATRSRFSVQVVHSLKGEARGERVVRQLGGQFGNEVVVVEGEELLQVGRLYLLATSDSLEEPGAEVVIGGPLSHQHLPDEAAEQAAVGRWNRAIQQQRSPDAFKVD